MNYIHHTAGEQPLNKHFTLMERHLYNPDVISCSQRDVVVWAEKGFGRIYWSVEDIERLNKESKALLDYKNARKLIINSKKAEREYWQIAKEVLEKVNNRIKRYELAQAYDKYSIALRNVLAYFPATGPHLTHTVELELRNLNCSDEDLIDLTTPAKEDLLNKELKEWKNILNNPTKENILAHTKKYSVMLPNTFSDKQVFLWANKRIKEKSLNEIDSQITESKNKRKELKKRQEAIFLKLDNKKIENLSWFIREAAIVRLLLKACWNGEAYHMLPFYNKISEIAQCSVRDLCMFYTWRDISVLLHNDINLPKNVLESRKQHYLLHYGNWEIKISTGKRALRKRRKVLMSSMPDENIESITGMTANKGKVIGKVKVVKTDNPSEFYKIADSLTKDHILVTGMTNPAMIIMMEKVKGIITDEGGMACHAAIVSREFGIPCIVGTKIATQVLKDEEKIELDADNGIVRRLEPHN